jgi:lincosamide nucleotidyltransferase A/C/D/E
MTSNDVINFYTKLKNLGIEIWIDGGWGVDALLGEQTRPHTDLDIVIQQKDLKRARELLEAQGYKDVERDDTRAWNFVLGNAKGNEIDFHVIVLDEKGNGIYGPAENGEMYPADSLCGTGIIAGCQVKCVSAEFQVNSHTGYKLKEKDYKDVSALCKKFGLDFPEEYAHLKNSRWFSCS